MPLRTHPQIQPAGIARGAGDGPFQVKFFGRALAGKVAQAAQRDLDVARAEFDVIVEVSELAFCPDLDRRTVLAPAAEAYAFWMRSTVAEGRRSTSSYPLVAPGVALGLLGQALLQGFHQFVPAVFFQLGALGVGQVLFHRLAQPVFGNQHVHAGQCLDALEILAEGAVEFVEVRFVLDQRRSRQHVEVVQAVFDHMFLQGLEQHQKLLGRYRELAGLEVEEEVDQHSGRTLP